MNMTRTLALLLALASLSACASEPAGGTLPPSPSAAGSAATGSSATSTTSMVGPWESNALATVPGPKACANFRFEITSQTATSIAGTFSAVCGHGLALSGSTTGQLLGETLAFSFEGAATIPGTGSCQISLSGTGTIEDKGQALRLAYSGTTCLGPVSGTEVLHKK
jgi:hypothetical protein